MTPIYGQGFVCRAWGCAVLFKGHGHRQPATSDLLHLHLPDLDHLIHEIEVLHVAAALLFPDFTQSHTPMQTSCATANGDAGSGTGGHEPRCTLSPLHCMGSKLHHVTTA